MVGETLCLAQYHSPQILALGRKINKGKHQERERKTTMRTCIACRAISESLVILVVILYPALECIDLAADSRHHPLQQQRQQPWQQFVLPYLRPPPFTIAGKRARDPSALSEFET